MSAPASVTRIHAGAAEARRPDGGALYATALRTAALFAVSPTLGLWLRARPGPVRERFLADLRALLPADTAMHRLPPNADAAALTGGLDHAATLAAGRPVHRAGLLAGSDGGVLIAPMAERLAPELLGPIAAALDTGAVPSDTDRDASRPARFGLIACDESLGEDEAIAHALADRLALVVDLDGADPRRATAPSFTREAVAFAARRCRTVPAGSAADTLCAAAAAYGIVSLRAPVQALIAARAAAALAGVACDHDTALDMAIGAVLSPRAIKLPEAPSEAGEPADDPREGPRAEQGESAQHEPDARAQAQAQEPDAGCGPPEAPPLEKPRTDEANAATSTVDAAAASLPADLLARLGDLARLTRIGRGGAGRTGRPSPGAMRGRAVGTRRGDVRSGRIDIAATLAAAAPWQTLRRSDTGDDRIVLRPDDIRIRRHKARRETATIFVVDTSGSAALARMAEAKGAVEIILSECYLRRDRVALVAFRGTTAECVLPETRSLTRARRALAALPAGGGTPLAAGLAEALRCARLCEREGRTPLVAVLTDGRANIARDGSAGRPAAKADAEAVGRAIRAAGFASLVIDTGQRPGTEAHELSAAMGARWLALPRADAAAIARAVGATERPAPGVAA